jgi:hypothetical protein
VRCLRQDDAVHWLDAGCTLPGMVEALVLAEDGSPSPDSRGLGGMLATCLAFIVAAVAAVAGLRPSGRRSIVGALEAARVAVIRTAQPRAPNLAQLCLLRT